VQKERTWRRVGSNVVLPGAAGVSCLALLGYTGLEGLAWALGLGLAGLIVGAISSRSSHAEGSSFTASSRRPD
jgi:hypothetical protein